MTRDDIINMVQETIITCPNENPFDFHLNTLAQIERFAALVAAAEREKVAAWMMQRSYATGHGDTIEDLSKELEWQVAEREREECAKLCEEEGLLWGQRYAAAIRARGNT